MQRIPRSVYVCCTCSVCALLSKASGNNWKSEIKKLVVFTSEYSAFDCGRNPFRSHTREVSVFMSDAAVRTAAWSSSIILKGFVSSLCQCQLRIPANLKHLMAQLSGAGVAAKLAMLAEVIWYSKILFHVWIILSLQTGKAFTTKQGKVSHSVSAEASLPARGLTRTRLSVMKQEWADSGLFIPCGLF